MLVFQATVTCRRLYLNSDLVHQITRDYHLKPQQRLSSESNNGKVTSQAARGKIINASIPKFKGIHGMITKLGIFLFSFLLKVATCDGNNEVSNSQIQRYEKRRSHGFTYSSLVIF